MREQLFADLTTDPRIVTAAHIGHTFKKLPSEVLRLSRRDFLIDQAGAEVIARAKTPVPDEH